MAATGASAAAVVLGRWQILCETLEIQGERAGVSEKHRYESGMREI